MDTVVRGNWSRGFGKAGGGVVERAKEVDWAGKEGVVFDHGEQNADPLTFFSLLASVAGGQAEKREKIYSSIADVFEIESNLDYRSEDGFILPNPPAINLKFYSTGGGIPPPMPLVDALPEVIHGIGTCSIRRVPR